MSQVSALVSKWNSEQAIDNFYRNLIITSADSDSGKMEGYLDSFDRESNNLGNPKMTEGVFRYEASSQGSTLTFKMDTAQFNLKADDRTFNRLYGDVTLGDGTVSPCAFKKLHV